MPENISTIAAPSRVWGVGMLGMGVQRQRRPWRRMSVIKAYQGFFLLEADACKQADYLNREIRKRYVARNQTRLASGQKEFDSLEAYSKAYGESLYEPTLIVRGELHEEALYERYSRVGHRLWLLV